MTCDSAARAMQVLPWPETSRNGSYFAVGEGLGFEGSPKFSGYSSLYISVWSPAMQTLSLSRPEPLMFAKKDKRCPVVTNGPGSAGTIVATTT